MGDGQAVSLMLAYSWPAFNSTTWRASSPQFGRFAEFDIALVFMDVKKKGCVQNFRDLLGLDCQIQAMKRRIWQHLHCVRRKCPAGAMSPKILDRPRRREGFTVSGLWCI